jgi:glycosyltransferase involved in cell wall biosynthesis
VFKPRDSTFKRKNAITGKFLILGVANVWSDRKGLTDFLKLRQLLDDSFSIVLVGLSRKQIDNLPVGIIGVQRTANTQELAEIYSAADIFVNASYEETMGLVTVEALACGTPAIVYDKTAIPEVIDQNSGLVITAGDVMKVREAIKTILDNSGEFTGTRKRAEKYEKRMQYEKYMHIYDEMI